MRIQIPTDRHQRDSNTRHSNVDIQICRNIDALNHCATAAERRVHYLAGLKDTNGVSLLHHRRKTFVTGLILISTGTKKLANIILNQEITPFSDVLTYKYSQDHLQLLNSCIRGKTDSTITQTSVNLSLL